MEFLPLPDISEEVCETMQAHLQKTFECFKECVMLREALQQVSPFDNDNVSFEDVEICMKILGERKKILIEKTRYISQAYRDVLIQQFQNQNEVIDECGIPKTDYYYMPYLKFLQRVAKDALIRHAL